MNTPMDPVEMLKPNTGKPVDQLKYSRAIGCLMYNMTSTRPDIAYVVGRLMLEGYTDASWINYVEDSSSTSGWVFLLGGGAISWASKKQTCSSHWFYYEYEFVALVRLVEELKGLLMVRPHVQQEKLKAVKARLNFEETSQYSELGAPSREETSGNDSDQKMPAACLEALNQDAADCKMVYSTGWVIKNKVCPHIPVVHQVSTTRRTKRKLLSCKFPARELSAPGTAQSPKRIQSLRRKRPITGVPSKSKFQKAKCSIIEDDDNPKPMEARRLIRSRLASAILIYQRGSVCLVMSKRMYQQFS
ncbi:hypothetical protein Tco_1090005 [Tanacetum coccineum]|uniref:Zinc finger, CCHC-type n=1 Tax=Tanacetum coccineum TaxID=301880 RepID=A0ABQ5I2Y1_9ASTR